MLPSLPYSALFSKNCIHDVLQLPKVLQLLYGMRITNELQASPWLAPATMPSTTN